ncbi:MAG: PASTA domain-containing protein [Atopobiaceae bacterium]|nr:PASTA domain-containing protein [Atopobiaceae bacterium]
MECPYCNHPLAGGVLPARCPYCGKYLGAVGAIERGNESAKRASEIRREVEGLVGTRRYKRVGLGSFLVALGLVALSLAAVVGIGMHLGFFGAVAVPDVQGWLLERAERELENRGFSVTVKEEASQEEVGFVLRTDPAANSSLMRGELITIFIAKERVMPDVVGKDITEVKDELDKMGVSYTVHERASDEPNGTVIESSKEAGTAFGYKESIIITVASPIKVPQIMGLSEGEALAALAEMGLEAEVSYVDGGSTQAEDKVVGVEPPEGTELAAGTVVQLSVTDYARNPETVANKLIEIIYNTKDPQSIGGQLRRFVSSEFMVRDQNTNQEKPATQASDLELWYGVVKAWDRFPDTGGKEQSLPRELIQTPQISAYGNNVSAYIQIRWDQTAVGMGTAYWYGHTITMEFDDNGKLISYSDPEADVPRNLTQVAAATTTSVSPTNQSNQSYQSNQTNQYTDDADQTEEETEEPDSDQQ